MLFRHTLYPAIKRGDVTVTYRRWKRAQVRRGGRYRLDAAGVVEVISIGQIEESTISAAHARAAGYADRAALLRELTRFDSGDGASQVYRVTFRYVPAADPRMALASNDVLTPDEAAIIIDRLDRMDRDSRHGAWTRATLSLIAGNPGTLAATLAERLGREKLPFKADVRKLKALGLTISLETGYRISPRGLAILRRIQNRGAAW